METSQVLELSAQLSTRTRVRIWAVRIFVVGVTLLVTLAGLELLLDHYYAAGEPQNWTAFHPVRGWALVPGNYWNKPLSELHRVNIHINEWGLRGPSEASSASAKRKVVVLGDSFVLSLDSEY